MSLIEMECHEVIIMKDYSRSNDIMVMFITAVFPVSLFFNLPTLPTSVLCWPTSADSEPTAAMGLKVS